MGYSKSKIKRCGTKTSLSEFVKLMTETEAMNRLTDKQSGLADREEFCHFGTLEVTFKTEELRLN